MVQDKRLIDASKVTKPIQLLAAWLVGLIAVNGSFLGAAAVLAKPDWASGALVVAAMVNVPLFLVCLFLLQTKFRPEMQEDSYYSRHLERMYSEQTQKISYVQGSTGLDTITSRALEVDHIKPASTSKLKYRYISINDFLPKYRDIIDRLTEAGLRPTDTFGSTSEDPVPLKKFVVSIGRNAPLRIAQKVIETVKPFGLDGIGIGDHFAPENIYIGAYSYDDSTNYVPADSEDANELLSPNITKREFLSIIEKYDHEWG